MAVPIKITKEIRTMNFGGRTITLNQNETTEQAISRIQNPTANGGGHQEVEGKEVEEGEKKENE